MAMLAEPRRRQKWTLNPRGKHWSDDSNKFGQKMLEKMGWSNGKGLGANLDGMTDHIRLKFKNDQAGFGFSNDDRDKQWTEHQEGFNELLQKLHNNEEPTAPVAETDLSGKSLELKSKQSRSRVHYQKFTRGKDVNKYSAKDLANIFGKKDLSEKPCELEKIEIEEDTEELAVASIGTRESSHGVVTIKGGSLTDYFKTKMSSIARKVDVTNDYDSESDIRTGFGFTSINKKSETPIKVSENYSNFMNPSLDITRETKHTPKRRKNDFTFENPALDIANVSEEANETPKKRKTDNFEVELSDVDRKNTPKRRKSEYAFENPCLDLEDTQNDPQTATILDNTEISKKKRKKKPIECITQSNEGFCNEALNLESRDNEISSACDFEVTRTSLGLANNALDLTDETNGKKRVTFSGNVEYNTDLSQGKRKKKKNPGKLDKFEVDNEKMKRRKKKERKDVVEESAFVNEAMDIDPVCQEASDNAANERKIKRSRKKHDKRISNLETITELPDEEKETPIEIVTLDENFVCSTSENLETLSLETPKKTKKNKKKKCKTVQLDSTIDISEEDLEIVEEVSVLQYEEIKINQNNEKEKKKKNRDTPDVSEIQEVKKKKKKHSIDESKENVAENNIEILETSQITKKPKKSRKDKKQVDDNKEPEVNVDYTQSPGDMKAKKSKKIFKTLFSRSPVVNFVGSNINDIKGYGVE